jgi:hypothetical protein
VSYTIQILGNVKEAFDLSQAQAAAVEIAGKLDRPVTVLRDGEPFCTYHPGTCPFCEGNAKTVKAEFHDRE